MLGMHMGHVPAPTAAEDKGDAPRRRDTCDWLFAVNRASLLTNLASSLLEKPLARTIAAALDAMEGDWENAGSARPELYITFEPELLKRCGMQASVLHIGRSSQDIIATANAGLNLERLTRLIAAAADVVTALQSLAERETDAVVPAYTNGVQAQPTLFSHTVNAHQQAFLRDIDRAFECITRFDACPMGSAVCNGTGWPLDSRRMAELLGFARTAANAYDAGQIAGNDLPVEMSQIVTSMMLHVNAFLADFITQYAQVKPWIRLGGTNGVYRSSAMPQKRNPGLVNDCRRDAGTVIGEAQGVLMRTQNLAYGMPDVRDCRLMEAFSDDACVTLRTFASIVNTLTVDHERALAELNTDWTCTQEIADRLVRLGHVDFRSGHRFASRLVTWARENGVTPVTLTYENVTALWQDFYAAAQEDAAEKEAQLPATFPLAEADLKAALNPANIVAARATPGSTSPEETRRLLAAAKSAETAVRVHWDTLTHRRTHTLDMLKTTLAAALA